MGQELVLKYSGRRVDDGSIGVKELISGLEGLVKVSDVIIGAYAPQEKDAISLRVKGFREGSFETLLEFVRENEAFTIGTATVLSGVIIALSHYIANGKPPQNMTPQVHNTFITITGDVNNVNIVKKGYHSFSDPIQRGEANMLSFGSPGSPTKIMDESDVGKFIIEKWVEMKGEIVALNKKTLKGKFVSESKRDNYAISLVMENPRDYFHYFTGKITISGTAIRDEKSGKIERIEVEKIQRAESAGANQNDDGR